MGAPARKWTASVTYAEEIRLLTAKLEAMAQTIAQRRQIVEAEMDVGRRADMLVALEQADWVRIRGELALEILSGRVPMGFDAKKYPDSCAFCLGLTEKAL